MNPLLVIDALRTTDSYIESIFLEGSCYRFHLFLKKLFPEAIPFISHKKNHIYTKIGTKMYDILGEIEKWEENYITPLLIEDLPEVENWSFQNFNYLKVGECPLCEEPLIV